MTGDPSHDRRAADCDDHPPGENGPGAGERSGMAATVDLESFVLSSDATAAEALPRLRRNGPGVLFVVEDDRRVVGALTDAHLRRAVLDGRPLDAPVMDIVSTRPVAAGPHAPEAELVELMLSHRLTCVPILVDGRLVTVRFLEEFRHERPAPVALIMAGGRGVRLRPVTDKVPKPLLRLGSRSIVERIVSAMVPTGVAHVFLAVNYMAEVFEQRLGGGERLGVHLHYLREERPMGTAGALSLLPRDVSGPILVANGDIVTTLDFRRLLDFHWRHGGAVTVAGVEYVSDVPYGVLRVAQHHLLSIEEKPERRDLCSAGIYVLEPDVLRLLEPDTPLDMPNLIDGVLAEGLSVQVFPVMEKWFDIGGTAEFERILVDFATGEEE
ncbi:MAG TPA: nucleotidyltransferase family protein [Acidimicrobiales bacterium]|nr:nucleotidyltransferase family protein [Acidimicrobiales bacterium]